MDQVIDLLDRNEFVDRVLQVVNQLSDNGKGSSFSIEGSWGIGKTFVLNELWRKLEIEDEKYFLFHYNCWKYDYYEEPAVAIMSAMKTSIKKDSTIINTSLEDTVKAGYDFVKRKFKEIAGIYLKNKIGINLFDWIAEIDAIKENSDKADREFDNMFSFNQAIEEVREKMAEIAEERTIVLIVDELDRCIPQYAIKVLERLHHLFYGLENVVVIMAIDRSQLEHSVEEMFGMRRSEDQKTQGVQRQDSMDIERYLKKFIDFSIVLDYGNVNDRYQEKYPFYFDRFLLAEGEKQLLDQFLSTLFKEIDIRRIEKMVEKANVVHSVICEDKVDISVLAFEMLYEILRFFDAENMECVLFAGERGYSDFDNLKDVRQELFKQMNRQSRVEGYNNKFYDNFYGKILWYCVDVFCPVLFQGSYAYDFPGFDNRYARELEVVQKYYDFRKTIN